MLSKTEPSAKEIEISENKRTVRPGSWSMVGLKAELLERQSNTLTAGCVVVLQTSNRSRASSSVAHPCADKQ